MPIQLPDTGLMGNLQGLEAPQKKLDLQELIENIRGSEVPELPNEGGFTRMPGAPKIKQSKEGNYYSPVPRKAPKKPTEEQRLSDEIEKFQGFLSRPDAPAKQKIAVYEAQEKAQKRLDKIAQDREKKYGPQLNKLHDEYKAASRLNDSIDTMLELNSSGQLPSNAWYTFLKTAGLDAPGALGEAGEKFLKTRQSFIKGAKEALGGRITNFELDEWLKGFGSLENSPGAIQANLLATKEVNDLMRSEYKIAQKILSKNKNIAPADLQAQIDRKLKKRKDKIAEKIKKLSQNPVGQGSSKGAALGAKVAGHAFWPAIGAGVGALAAGPLGAAIGGLGGLAAPKASDYLSRFGGGGGGNQQQ